MARPPSSEFGKRKPAVPAVPSPPVKRSHHVALLLTGTLAVGGSALAFMPRGGCEPNQPGMAGPSSPEAAANCARSSSHGGSGGGGHWSSRSSFFGGDGASSSSSSSVANSGETSRGGFGSYARSFAAHFSGG